MGNANVKKQNIERASKSGVLQLRDASIKEVPTDVLVLQSTLRLLDVSRNKIEVIPSFVGHFKVLKQITADSNRLSHLPDEIGSCKKLESLSLSHNQLSALPDSIGALIALKTVNISHNRLRHLPACFSNLRKLDTLDLSGNQIESLPDEVSNLFVSELNLSQNRLSTLNDQLAACPRLKVLRVEENCLPISAFTPALLRDSKLSLIAYEGNLFDLTALQDAEGYVDYAERYTAVKKKMF